MCSLKPRIAFPKAVRARYEKEERGFIRREDGGNFELEVQSIAGVPDCLNAAKCIAQVKSVSTGQTHECYKLLKSEWVVSAAKVELDSLVVVVKSGCKQKQKNERGYFKLEFTLILSNGSVCPSYITHVILDESYRETCRPKIKSMNPQCAVGGEEVWIECSNNIATTSVEAVLSGVGGQKEHSAECVVVGKLVKFKLPYLYVRDKLPNVINEDAAKLQLRIVVDKNGHNISSDPVTFTYLSQKFRRPEAKESTPIEKCSRKRKVDRNCEISKTFDSNNIIGCYSANQENGYIEVVEPKSMSGCCISQQPRTFQSSPKAFHDVKTALPKEKIKPIIHSLHPCVPNEVALPAFPRSKTIQDPAPGEEQSYNVLTLQSATTIEHEKNACDALDPPELEKIPLLGIEQDLIKVSTAVTQKNVEDSMLGHTSTSNNTDPYYSEEQLRPALSPSRLPICQVESPSISSPLFNDYTNDDQFANIDEEYRFWTTVGPDYYYYDISEYIDSGGTDNTMAGTTVPARYGGHDHNPDMFKQPQALQKGSSGTVYRMDQTSLLDYPLGLNHNPHQDFLGQPTEKKLKFN